MKRLFTLLTTLAFAQLSIAQIEHTDLSPDEVFQCALESSANEFIDLDGDNEDDINFVFFNFPSFNIWNLGLAQLDTNDKKVEFAIDKSVPKSQIGDYYVKPLSANSTISANSDFSNDYPQVGDIYNSNFVGLTDKYIGFRLNSDDGYLYGWMSVELTASGPIVFTIKEYAYNSSPDGTIQVGQSNGVGIEHKDLKSANMSFYPNPAQNYVKIAAKKDKTIDEVRIYNIQGALVKQISKPTLPLTIETAGWNKGSYFIQVIEEGKVYNDLLIKE